MSLTGRLLLSVLMFFTVSLKAFSAEANFLALTDIHFDPFSGCPASKQQPCPLIQQLRAAPASQWESIFARQKALPSSYWSDTSYALLDSALATAGQAANNEHAKFVLVLGDELTHEFRARYREYSQDQSRAGVHQFAKKTLEFLKIQLAQTFPSISVYSLAGNNDSYGGNYYSSPRGQFYADMAQLWSGLIKDKSTQTDMRKQFQEAGYYAVTLPGTENLRLIMLNTVLFSNKARGKNIHQAAEQELTWLHQQLLAAQSNKQRVLIAMHIPKGIDVLSLFKLPIPLVSDLWQAQYIKQFDAEIKAFAPQIVALLAGHVHSGGYQVLRFNDLSTIPVIGVPSISPVYGNHPAFKAYAYSLADKRLSELRTYYFSMQSDAPWSVAVLPRSISYHSELG